MKCGIYIILHRLKKVSAEEKQPEKADPMLNMMERIRSGNVQLKRVQNNPAPKSQKAGSGDVMSEMAKLLVSVDLWCRCCVQVCIAIYMYIINVYYCSK